MTSTSTLRIAGWLFVAAAAVSAPFIVHPLFAMQILCFALFAAAFNLLAGYLGLISFGHAAFFGVGAYISGYAVRRHGVYFAMITLALAQLVYFICHQAPFTGGEDGMAGIPRGYLFGVVSLSNNLVMYCFVLAIVSASLFVIYRVVNSPFGLLLQAIRDNDRRATSLGYEIERAKLVAFILSAGLTGLAGAIKAIVFQFASQTDILWSTSGVPVLASLIGGIGTLPGPVIGAAVMVALENLLGGLGQWVFFVQGAIFVFVVMFFRKGIYGEVLDFVARRRAPRDGEPKLNAAAAHH